jgi:nucleoside 2-deoxyribosyltransferase
MNLYLIGSLRNLRVPELASIIRHAGFSVFDDWHAAGPEADDYWRDYEKAKGHNMAEALAGHAAQHVFGFDKKFLDLADAGILLMPAGKSGHLEAGYMVGCGKPMFMLFEEDPERFDIMLNFFTSIHYNIDSLLKELSAL